jgi:hypothetical protein
MNLLHHFDFTQWTPTLTAEQHAQALRTLEGGGVLVLPHLPFVLRPEEEKFLSPTWSNGKAKNISLRPRSFGQDEFKGAQGSPEDLSALQAMVQRYREQATALVRQVFPAYQPYLQEANTSYRPFEITARQVSYRKDDTRLHADAFPSNPTCGTRLLRVFTNINPHGVARNWRLGEPFSDMVAKFLPGTKPLWPGQSWLMHKLHITKRPRTEYDHLMLQLHDHVKADLDYQANCRQLHIDFAPGTTWVVFSDQVLHAAMSGQFLMEQTFHLPVTGLVHPELSPLRVLEKIKRRALV